jgi:hypothetical protein
VIYEQTFVRLLLRVALQQKQIDGNVSHKEVSMFLRGAIKISLAVKNKRLGLWAVHLHTQRSASGTVRCPLWRWVALSPISLFLEEREFVCIMVRVYKIPSRHPIFVNLVSNITALYTPKNEKNSVAWACEWTVPTEWPPLVGEGKLVPIFADGGVSRGQRGGSLQP